MQGFCLQQLLLFSKHSFRNIVLFFIFRFKIPPDSLTEKCYFSLYFFSLFKNFQSFCPFVNFASMCYTILTFIFFHTYKIVNIFEKNNLLIIKVNDIGLFKKDRVMSKHIFSPGHRVFALIELILNFWCNFSFFYFPVRHSLGVFNIIRLFYNKYLQEPSIDLYV